MYYILISKFVVRTLPNSLKAYTTTHSRMMPFENYSLLTAILILQSCTSVAPSSAIVPIPNSHQQEWQEMELYGFIHFSINTFTDVEWGYGNKSPELFNPTELDTRESAKIAKEADMGSFILTNKQYDGFYLWPSEHIDYSVKNSPCKNGEGDVVRELAESEYSNIIANPIQQKVRSIKTFANKTLNDTDKVVIAEIGLSLNKLSS